MTCEEAIKSATELIEHLHKSPMGVSYTDKEVIVMVDCLIDIMEEEKEG